MGVSREYYRIRIAFQLIDYVRIVAQKDRRRAWGNPSKGGIQIGPAFVKIIDACDPGKVIEQFGTVYQHSNAEFTQPIHESLGITAMIVISQACEYAAARSDGPDDGGGHLHIAGRSVDEVAGNRDVIGLNPVHRIYCGTDQFSCIPAPTVQIAHLHEGKSFASVGQGVNNVFRNLKAVQDGFSLSPYDSSAPRCPGRH